MSRAIIEAPVSDEVLAAVAEGWKAYEAATRELGPTDNFDRRMSDLIDKQIINDIIRAFVRQGRPFSANDLRPQLPEVRKCLISRQLIRAQNDGLIRYVGVTPSTLRSTKAARVNVYAPIPGALA